MERQMDKNLCYRGNLARMLGRGEGTSKQQRRTCLPLIKEWSGSARGSKEAIASTWDCAIHDRPPLSPQGKQTSARQCDGLGRKSVQADQPWRKEKPSSEVRGRCRPANLAGIG